MIDVSISTFTLYSCFQMEFVDNDTQDIFSTDLNSWVAVDHKLDGWKEFPIPWPAILIPKGLLICYLDHYETFGQFLTFSCINYSPDSFIPSLATLELLTYF